MARKTASLIFLLALFSSRLTAQTDTPLPSPAVADKVVVLKRERKLLLLQGDKTLKTYRIALGANPTGTKTHQGDHRTPEGQYILDRHNEHSLYHRSIHISYPNAEDVARAHTLGLSPGGLDFFLLRIRIALGERGFKRGIVAMNVAIEVNFTVLFDDRGCVDDQDRHRILSDSRAIPRESATAPAKRNLQDRGTRTARKCSFDLRWRQAADSDFRRRASG